MNIAVARRITRGLGLPRTVGRLTWLRKGFSFDRKYLLWAGDAPCYLLRLAPLADEARRREEFAIISQLAAAGVACPRPYHFGVSAADEVCFSVVAYLPGTCARDTLPTLSEAQQYAIGIAAGRELRRMHSAITAPADRDWYAYRTGKYARLKDTAAAAGLTFPRQAEIERFVAERLDLLRDRPVAFQHDDYHPGNLVVDGDRFAGIIDFGRYDWGDPWHEFFKLAHLSVPVSQAFSRGQVDGYFNGTIPPDFWPLYTLYVAMAFYGDLVWTARYWPRLLPPTRRRHREILVTHDFVAGGPPTWYAAPATAA